MIVIMLISIVVLRGRDPTAVAVLMEDSAAVSGVFLAASCLGLAYYTGNPVYDAIGSICIGGNISAWYYTYYFMYCLII